MALTWITLGFIINHNGDFGTTTAGNLIVDFGYIFDINIILFLLKMFKNRFESLEESDAKKITDMKKIYSLFFKSMYAIKLRD